MRGVSVWLARLWGLWGLLRIGLDTRFRFGGPYWAWRDQTAFGRGRPKGFERVTSVLDYGAWVNRMRRGA